MRNWKTLIAVLALCAAAQTLAAEPSEALVQKPQTLKRKITRTLRADYLLSLPKDYAPRVSKRWPLILFLHGAGERGTNLAKVTVHGPPKLVKQGKDFPFIIVSPQCPDGQTWSNELLLALLDDVCRKHKVDTNRIYLTGLSMGGYGTWSLGIEHCERFAAIAPICGGGEPIRVLLASRAKADALKALPVWAFHGAKDPVVKLEESERMVNAFKKLGAQEVKLTIYPEATHDSWTETYANPTLYEWFLKHQRGRPAERRASAKR
jgi:predicted peptidase